MSGDRPPPGAEELRLRPLDVSALLDAVESGRSVAWSSVEHEAVAVVGHSWGGAQRFFSWSGVPTDRKLKVVAVIFKDPERNLSWVLQCSWLSGINKAGVADQRVKAVVAVSPPLRLLFEPSSSASLTLQGAVDQWHSRLGGSFTPRRSLPCGRPELLNWAIAWCW